MKSIQFSALVIVSASLILGCGGAGGPIGGGPGNVGGISFDIVGAAQAPVTSSAAFGANVTGIAGGLVDLMTLSPQGPPNLFDTKIAFGGTRFSNNSQICVMNPDGTNVTRLTNNTFFEDQACWSKDGTKIVFSSSRGTSSNYEVVVMNSDGTNQVNVTNNAFTDYTPSWSPDGTKIVFATSRDGNYEIYTMNADGTGLKRLTNSASVDIDPSWSPDGTKIAFETNRDGNYDIYTMKTDGSSQTQLTTSTSSDVSPRWSPDGKKISFTTSRDGVDEIYTMNPDGSSQTRITVNGSSDGAASWSPDGSMFSFDAFRDGNPEIYTMTSFGGNQTNQSRSLSASQNSSWSPYLPRTSKSLIGATGILGTAAAGFLVGQNDTVMTSIVTFDTTSPASRAGARIVNQTASETQGSNLIFSLTTTSGLATINFASIVGNGNPGTVVNTPIPVGSTGALISFSSSLGTVTSVIPYAANRGSELKKTVSGDLVTYTGTFEKVYDGKGTNCAPTGASSITLNSKTGELVKFQ